MHPRICAKLNGVYVYILGVCAISNDTYVQTILDLSFEMAPIYNVIFFNFNFIFLRVIYSGKKIETNDFINLN